MRYGDGGGVGWGGWFVMVAMMIVFWGAIAWVVVTLIRHGGSRPEPTATGARPQPERILDERYARGEIDDEEYRRRRAVLRGDT